MDDEPSRHANDDSDGNADPEAASVPLAPGYRLHDLRHSAITAWVDQGVELATVQRWAGHQSLKTTNRYVHATDRAECAAVTLLKEAWKGFGGGPLAAE